MFLVSVSIYLFAISVTVPWPLGMKRSLAVASETLVIKAGKLITNQAAENLDARQIWPDVCASTVDESSG